MSLFLLRLSLKWNRYLLRVQDCMRGYRFRVWDDCRLTEDQAIRCQIYRNAIDLAAPVEILNLKRKGGPDKWDYQWLQEAALDKLLVDSDARLCGFLDGEGHKRGLLGVLCRAIAIMAFCPGGVEIFGVTYEANSAGGTQW